MRILGIRACTVPYGSAIANSYINFRAMSGTAIAIETDVVKDGKRVVGYGFNSIGRYECTSLVMDRMVPKLMARKPEELLTEDGSNLDPFAINRILKANEKPGGHGDRAHAIGGIDMAVWDAVAKIEEKPLFQLLGERYGDGSWDKDIYTYGAGGYYYDSGSDEKLRNEFLGYLDMGFNDVKLKIGADLKLDMHRIEVALSVLDGKGSRLMVDANGRLDLAQALEYGRAMQPYGLRWFEEPVDPINYMDLASLAENYPGAIATGENIFSFEDTRNLVRHGGMRADRDLIQVDCPLSYGLVEYLKILDYLRSMGWSARQCIPHGGHLFCTHIAAGLKLGGNECYPGVFQPFGGFSDDIPIVGGRVAPPAVPGIGFETKANLWKVFCECFG